jgi:hypothetical protein
LPELDDFLKPVQHDIDLPDRHIGLHALDAQEPAAIQ